MNRKWIPVLLLVLLVGIGAAATVSTVPSSGDITSQSNSGFELTSKNTTVYPEQSFDPSNGDRIIMQNGSVRSAGDAEAELEGIEMSGNVTVDIVDAEPTVFVEPDGRKNVGMDGLAKSITIFSTCKFSMASRSSR